MPIPYIVVRCLCLFWVRPHSKIYRTEIAIAMHPYQKLKVTKISFFNQNEIQ